MHSLILKGALGNSRRESASYSWHSSFRLRCFEPLGRMAARLTKVQSSSSSPNARVTLIARSAINGRRLGSRISSPAASSVSFGASLRRRARQFSMPAATRFRRPYSSAVTPSASAARRLRLYRGVAHHAPAAQSACAHRLDRRAHRWNSGEDCRRLWSRRAV
jgi:hypothetical protein